MGDKELSGEVIGIDLGTTFSCVAVARKGRAVEIIANDQGNRTTPSYVAFSPASAASSERLIGESANNQATLNPRRTIFDVKRLIGKKFDDPDVQSDLKYLPYPVVERDGKPCVEMEVNEGEMKSFTPEEISAMVLGKMKETAEAYLGKEVTNAVVTVPAYFNDSQRQATKDAGIIAGLNVVRIINEPTAGALAYGVNQDTKTKRNILVYDLGGGTFDVSVLEIDDGIFQVLATGGDTHLGGGDFDQRVMKYFVDLIEKRYRKDVSEDPKALGKLRRECERAKRVLSTQTQTRVVIDSLIQGMDFSEPLTRAKFEDLNLDLFERTLEVVKSTLKDSKVEKGNIDEVVLVGGSTRIPMVREMLKKAFDGKEPSKGINPDEAVAYGAAVQGAMLSSDGVGCGAILFDVIPLSLGVGILGDLMSIVVPRNTVIPTKKSRGYKTVEDNLTSVVFQVFQGERALTKDCLLLGSFSLTGIPPAPRGVASMEVTFEVDADGILSVTAKDEATENSKSLTIDSYKRNLNSRQIERMIREARQMAELDKKEKARVDARNCLEHSIYDLNKAVAEKLHRYHGDKTSVEIVLRGASEWFDNNKNAGMQEYEDRSKKLADLLGLFRRTAVEVAKGSPGQMKVYVPTNAAKAPSKKTEDPPVPVVSVPETESHVPSSDDAPTDSFDDGEVEGHSVYIRSLPHNVTVSQLEVEFKKFGPIKPGGVQVRYNKQQGYCFGFVEFLSPSSMNSAIEASPVLVGGRQSIVEMKRTSTRVGNGRGRFLTGRGAMFRNDSFRGGRGNYSGSGRGYSGRPEFNNNNRGEYPTVRGRINPSGGRGEGYQQIRGRGGRSGEGARQPNNANSP